MELNRRKSYVQSCGAVVYKLIDDEYHILLVQPSFRKQVWGFPKGHLEKGETLEECARREVYEETGLNVKLLEKLPDVISNNKKEIKRVHSWLAEQTDLTQKINPVDDENAFVEFWPIKNLPQIHVYQRDVINFVLNSLTFDVHLNQHIVEAVKHVSSYVGDTQNWLTVKKELLRSLPSDVRKLFSVRHERTKKHTVNMIESKIISFWKENTGQQLALLDCDRHN